MKTGDYYSSDYSKYPLNSLKPFAFIFLIFLFLFLFVLIKLFFFINIYIELLFSLILVLFIFYWVYLFIKYPDKKKNINDLILEKTRFEKQTAKDKFNEKSKLIYKQKVYKKN